MRITSKTVHDINKMEDNFALHMFSHQLVPSHGASRRRLRDKQLAVEKDRDSIFTTITTISISAHV